MTICRQTAAQRNRREWIHAILVDVLLYGAAAVLAILALTGCCECPPAESPEYVQGLRENLDQLKELRASRKERSVLVNPGGAR